MTKIRNLTSLPLKIPLSGDRYLHLGPAKEGQISTQAASRPRLLELAKEGVIEIVGGVESVGSKSDGSSPLHESTHGHPQPKMAVVKGNR